MNNQLPFDPYNPQGPFYQININNPPFVPNNIQVDQNLAPFLPFIAGCCAAELQSKAQTMPNPLRMFMFNQYAVNSYANEQFVSLVSAVVDYVMLQMYVNRVYQNPEQAISECVPRMVEMLCAINLSMFPQLQGMVSPDILQVASATAQTFNAVGQAIANMKQNFGAPQPQGYQGGYQQPQQPNYGGGGGYREQVQQRAGYGSARPFGGSANYGLVNPAAAAVDPTSGSARLFNSGQRRQPQGQQPMAGAGSTMSTRFEKGGSVKQPYVSKGTPMQDQNAPPVHNVWAQSHETPASVPTPAPVQVETRSQPPGLAIGEKVLASSGRLQFKPTKLANPAIQYLPAYTPSTHVLFLFLDSNYEVIPFLQSREEAQMKYDRHDTSSAFGKVPRSLPIRPATEALSRVQAGIDIMNGAGETPEGTGDAPDPVLPVTEMIRPGFLGEINLDTALMQAGVERENAGAEEAPEIFRTHVIVSEPFLTGTDQTAYIRRFGQAKSYDELAGFLNDSAADLDPSLWAGMNRRMTETVNRVLRQNLGLPKLAITSFAEDVHDLTDIIAEDFGGSTLNGWRGHQAEMIQRAFCALDEEFSETMAKSFLATDEDEHMAVTFLSHRCSITLLDVLSHELDIEVSAEVSSIVLSRYSPVMWALIDSLMRDPFIAENNFDRHLVKTRDSRVLEVTKGHTGKDVFLITLVE
jgi:hypothetical protein